MKRTLKYNKGITLVALVVTIIVLLILAAVSVNLVMGENGLITRARQASKLSSDDEIISDIKLKLSDYTIYKNIDGTENFSDYFKRVYNLDAYGGDNDKYFVEEGKKVVFIDLQNNIAKIAEKWDGTVASGFESGTGTNEDPYIIKTPEQLAYLQKSVSEGNAYSNMYFSQTESFVINTYLTQEKVDSDATSLKKLGMIGTSSTTPFSGWYIGNKNYIIGLYVDNTSNYSGLFGYLDDSYVYNLNVIGAYVNGGGITGGIGGNVTNNTYIINTTFDGIVKGTNYTGGIAGSISNYTLLRDCVVRGSVTGGSLVGGMTGVSASDRDKPTEIYYCYNYATINGINDVGGMTGKTQRGTLVDYCGNHGDVIGTESRIGGISGNGYNWGNVQVCYNYGNVRGDTSVGGISGGDQVSDRYCYNTGNISGNSKVGGIIGSMQANNASGSAFSINTGNITSADTNVGNISGYWMVTSGLMQENYYCSGSSAGVMNGNAAGAIQITEEQLKSTAFWNGKTNFPTSVWVFEDGKAPHFNFAK